MDNLTITALWEAVPPQTGDASSVGLWLTLLCISAAGMGTILLHKKRRA